MHDIIQLIPRNYPADECSNSPLLLFFSPKLFPSLFSSFYGAHRPIGSALFVVQATANPQAEMMTFLSIISALCHLYPTLFVSHFRIGLMLFRILVSTFFTKHSDSLLSSGLLLNPFPPSSPRFEWKPVEHKKQVWSCEEFTLCERWTGRGWKRKSYIALVRQQQRETTWCHR